MRQLFILMLVFWASTCVVGASDLNDICSRISSKPSQKAASLLQLCPAEFETISADAYGAHQTSTAAAAHPHPWSNTFYGSVPANLTAANLTAAPTPPVFAVIGDAMGALGFQLCDIEHYMEHSEGKHTLPECLSRAGWASKVAGAYGDKIWLFHQMIRATNNAQHVVVSEPVLRMDAGLHAVIQCTCFVAHGRHRDRTCQVHCISMQHRSTAVSPN